MMNAMIKRLANCGWLAYICQQYMRQKVLIAFPELIVDLSLTLVTSNSLRLVVGLTNHWVITTLTNPRS